MNMLWAMLICLLALWGCEAAPEASPVYRQAAISPAPDWCYQAILLDILPSTAASDPSLASALWWSPAEHLGATGIMIAARDGLSADHPALKVMMKPGHSGKIVSIPDGTGQKVDGVLWPESAMLPPGGALSGQPNVFHAIFAGGPQYLLEGFHADYDSGFSRRLHDVRFGTRRSSEIVNYIADKMRCYPRRSLSLMPLYTANAAPPTYGMLDMEAHVALLMTLPGIPLLAVQAGPAGMKFPGMTATVDTILERRLREIFALRRRHPWLSTGAFHALSLSMMSGAGAAYLRSDTAGAMLVLTNLKTSAVEKIWLSPPDSLARRYQRFRFVNWRDSLDVLRLEKQTLAGLYPLTTKIFIAAPAPPER